jgi:hypothetical protein
LLRARVASLEEEVGRLSRGKKRKAIPNLNTKFIALTEALGAGKAISSPIQAPEEIEAVEDAIKVGGVQEEEGRVQIRRRKSYLSHAPAQAAQLKKLREY